MSTGAVGQTNKPAPSTAVEIGIVDDNGKLQAVSSANPLPINGTIQATNPAVGVTGDPVPTDAQYAGMNVGGDLVGLTGTANGLQVDGSGVTQPVSAAALPLPTGAATAAAQNSAILALASIDTTLGSIDSTLSGTLTVAGTVDVASSALPAGAATEAKQDTGNTSLGSIDTKLTGVATAANQATGNTSLASIDTKLTGVATAAKQDTGNASVASIDGKFGSLGQKAMAGSAPVVLASDQAAIPVTLAAVNPATGRSKALLFRNDYSSTNVTTTAYVVVVASSAAAINRLYIFNGSGSAIILATGGAGSEVDQLYIPPGGSGTPLELSIPISTRIAIKALDVAATDGQIIITGLT